MLYYNIILYYIISHYIKSQPARGASLCLPVIAERTGDKERRPAKSTGPVCRMRIKSWRTSWYIALALVMALSSPPCRSPPYFHS